MNIRRQKHTEHRIPDAVELAAMPYNTVCDWAGADFDRLIAVGEARDYRPEWIVHQIEKLGAKPSEQEAKIIADMAVKAGPYLNRRQRWIIRHLKTAVAITEPDLIKLASTAEH